eukprot:SAG31_NODE_2455_length_5664_cov_1.921294_4_plen_46_part_00
MVETSFKLNPKKQFDQAGICIRLDHEHWIKTGEYDQRWMVEALQS